MAAIVTTPSPSGTAGSNQSHRVSFSIMTSLFFLWGFMTVLNDILIPNFKDAFQLNHFQAMLVQFAFFGAYFIGALLYFIISASSGDPIAKIGYKNGVVLGLLISSAGAALFWPAAGYDSYPMFLAGLFILALGFTMLQIAANPYITILGPESTASSRLNLAQGFNSVGTTIGPIIGGWLIYTYFVKPGDHGPDSVKVPYLAFSAIFLLLAVVFFFIHLPHIGEGRIEPGAGALKYPHVVLGILAIFMYVGGEVSVGSNIIFFLHQPSIAGMGASEASKYVSIFWGGLLIGRFMGAVELSDMKPASKKLFMVVIPVAALIVLLLAIGWGSVSHPQLDAATIQAALRAGWGTVRFYAPMVGLCWLLFQFGKSLAGRTLMLFASAAAALLAVAIVTHGPLAMWCVLGIGLFSSIGWSNTFSLAIEGVGIYKSQASSLLVMAILGGALLPPLQGLVADRLSIGWSFIVPLIAYAYVAFYGWKGHSIGRTAEASG